MTEDLEKETNEGKKAILREISMLSARDPEFNRQRKEYRLHIPREIECKLEALTAIEASGLLCHGIVLHGVRAALASHGTKLFGIPVRWDADSLKITKNSFSAS